MSTRKIDNNNNASNLGKKRSGPKAPKGSAKNKQGNTVVPRKRAHPVGPKKSTPARMDRKLTSEAEKKITYLKNGGIRIEMEEFIGPIYKPATAVITDGTGSQLLPLMRLRINPGSAKTFTWLSSMAVNYENYKFLKCEFYYLTRVGTSVSGSLIMSPDYDAEDGLVPITEKSIYSNKGTTDEAVYLDHSMKLIPASMHRLYKSHSVMSDDRFDSTSQDTKTVDCAQVHVLLDTDTTAALKMGKLIVKYIVELTEPQNPTDPANKGGFIMDRTSGILVGSAAPFTAAVPLGTGIKSDTGLLKPLVSIVGATYPNSTIGQFIKDYSGVINVATEGTGFSAFSSMYLNNKLSDLNAPVDSSLNDVAIPIDISPGGTSYGQNVSFLVKALAGDLLRIKTGAGTTLTNLAMLAGGSSALSLDL